MGLDELLRGYRRAEQFGKLLGTCQLGLAGTVGEEDVWDFDAELVVAVQNLEHALTLGDEAVAVNEDTVDVEDESQIFDGFDLLGLQILHLGGEDFEGWLDRGHPRACWLVSVLNHGQLRLPLRSGDGERSTAGVPGATAVPHRGAQAQVVHVLLCIADWIPDGWDLDCFALVRAGFQRHLERATARAIGVSRSDGSERV